MSNQLFLKPLDCILFQGFYFGWMRGTLIYDNSLSRSSGSPLYDLLLERDRFLGTDWCNIDLKPLHGGLMALQILPSVLCNFCAMNHGGPMSHFGGGKCY